MTKLLEGLEQVISGKTRGEDFGKGPTELPKLPEVSEAASVDYGDWAHQLENIMGDLSTGSADWWGHVKDASQQFFEQYQMADQFARLTLKPVASPDLCDPKWVRLDKRATTMLLQAVPEDVRKELVVVRARSTLEVMCRLMVLYRPGSATEKSQLLRKIETPEPVQGPQEAVEGLRLWLRTYNRAGDLSLVVPDPSILLKSLDNMVKKPLNDNPEILFRMQMLRYHLKLDPNPTADGVLAIHKAYLAEFEQIASRRTKPRSGNNNNDGAPNPRIRTVAGKDGKEGKDGRGGKEGKPCRYFLTDEGCRRGKDCKFEHVMDKDKRDRCWVCGAKGHTSRSCPSKTRDTSTSAGNSPTAAAKAAALSTSSSSSMAKRNDGRDTSAGGSSEVPVTGSSTSTTTTMAENQGQGSQVDQLLVEVQRMMKAFIDHKSPTIRALHLPEPASVASIQDPMETLMGRYGLIDSGATHPLRAAKSSKELEEAKQTSVVLAGDQRVSLPQTASGVILSETQPIVPLNSLVKTLGHEFVWNHKGCRLYHPTKPSIQVFTKSSCPEVRECDALRLIAELETEKVKEAMSSLSTLKAAIEST